MCLLALQNKEISNHNMPIREIKSLKIVENS